MSTYLAQVVFDALDPRALATFWREVLGWTTFIDEPDEVEILGGPDDVPLGFIPTTEPKRAKNRMHLDLFSSSVAHQREVVARCIDLGAVSCDIGQGDAVHTVLADPEGNEFCVLPPVEPWGETGAVAAICLDGADIAGQRSFWAAATGWVDREQSPRYVALRSATGGGPLLVMGPEVAPKAGKNRIHMDIRPPASGDHLAETERLIAAGARRADIGQRNVEWVVLADPEDNELCVLTPRDDDRVASSSTPDP